MLLAVLLFFTSPFSCFGQRAELRLTTPVFLPGISDSNSPAHWWNGQLRVYQSAGLPIMSEGPGVMDVLKSRAVGLSDYRHTPIWIEATWLDSDGTLYAWYHNEQLTCGDLSQPRIGALVSWDGGNSFWDLGLVAQTGYAPNCDAKNGYFAGGHGDFTVLLDQESRYFYFYFGNYSGPQESQGVAVARMAFEDRAAPVGKVWKYFGGDWREPGLGGRVTAILPVTTAWEHPDTDAFWGPALHWNTYLQQYVMLLNRACCEPGWPVGGIYVSYSQDLGDPESWSAPQLLLPAESSGWYPQVIGLGNDDSDKQAGQVARFFMGSDSLYEIVFELDEVPWESRARRRQDEKR